MILNNDDFPVTCRFTDQTTFSSWTHRIHQLSHITRAMVQARQGRRLLTITSAGGEQLFERNYARDGGAR